MKPLFFIFALMISLSASDMLMKYGPHLLERGLSRDGLLTKSDDGYVSLDLKTPFIIDGEKFHSIFVNVDGVITFDAPSSSFEPSKLEGPYIAPFWADVDLTGEIEEGNQIHYRVSENQEDTDWVRVTIQELSDSSVEWRPTLVVVATWDRVGPFMSRTDVLNTFQVVLATDGVESYAFHNYPSNGLNWWVSEQGQGFRAGYRTRKVEHSIEPSDLALFVRNSNATLARFVGGRMVKLDGYRPVLKEFAEHSEPCFFGGGVVSVHGYGFQQPSSQHSLVCRFSSSQTEHLILPATFVSSEEVECQVPALAPHQMINVSVSINSGSSWSEPVAMIMNDCILSYVPLEICLSSEIANSVRIEETSVLKVESFPDPWNSALQYSCKFGEDEVEASLNADTLSCQIPEFRSPQTVELKVVVKDGERKIESRKFGKMKVTDCSFILNEMEACGTKRQVVLISQQEGEKQQGFYGRKSGVLNEPNGNERNVQVEGKVLKLKVPEDGVYRLTFENERHLSFEIDCQKN